MKKIVTITGHKYTRKDTIATELAKNSEVEFVHPYTERDVVVDSGYDSEYHIVLPSTLDKMIKDEKVLAITTVNDCRYVFFEFQFIKPYSVIIADDYAVIDIKKNWNGEVFTIRAVSDNEEQSDRVGEYLFKHEFDAIFDYARDDIHELEAELE